jgi:hypothetical protein
MSIILINLFNFNIECYAGFFYLKMKIKEKERSRLIEEQQKVNLKHRQNRI